MIYISLMLSWLRGLILYTTQFDITRFSKVHQRQRFSSIPNLTSNSFRMPTTLTRKLGKNGPEIPPVGFGLMGIGIDCYGATGYYSLSRHSHTHTHSLYSVP